MNPFKKNKYNKEIKSNIKIEEDSPNSIKELKKYAQLTSIPRLSVMIKDAIECFYEEQKRILELKKIVKGYEDAIDTMNELGMFPGCNCNTTECPPGCCQNCLLMIATEYRDEKEIIKKNDLKMNEKNKDLTRKLQVAEVALKKIRGYNVSIKNDKINYRPKDHIQVIDEALAHIKKKYPMDNKRMTDEQINEAIAWQNEEYCFCKEVVNGRCMSCKVANALTQLRSDLSSADMQLQDASNHYSMLEDSLKAANERLESTKHYEEWYFQKCEEIDALADKLLLAEKTLQFIKNHISTLPEDALGQDKSEFGGWFYRDEMISRIGEALNSIQDTESKESTEETHD